MHRGQGLKGKPPLSDPHHPRARDRYEPDLTRMCCITVILLGSVNTGKV